MQDKVIMEECWESHWELQTEANLVLMKDQVCFYQVASFELTWVVNLKGAWTVEVDPLINSEVTRVDNKLGISDGGLKVITLVFSDRNKLGGDEG